ncbi:transcriptional regulator [Nocardioides baekrokdamisoli]|uniref:Transcriptional regulator n=1 Tax=Nocardioides baekrokdamisoli TaxID=1804624 RepID=A0A3G9J1N2_9ACTN|nr:FadR/GntR family transcriptional regulator [Nocardioides baekrokdamisoli]BBH17458.1 transcriptional regulator [Nocardioides baekrokdamisoli]
MSERLSKEVADALLARISTGEFPPGSRLPSEQELMAEYTVGRNTVREAMQGLRALGLVEIRPRLGARVLDGSAENALASSALAITLGSQTLRELYDVRLMLEPSAAALAATHRTDAELVAIKRAHAHFRLAHESKQPIWQADLEFHDAVAVASHNSVLPRILAPMQDLLINSRIATGAIPAAAQRALHEHGVIADAIEARDSRAARRAMTTHIRSAIWALGQIQA